LQNLFVKLGQFRRMDRRDRTTFLVAWAAMPMFWLRLRWGGISQFQKFLVRPDGKRPASLSAPRAEAIGLLVNSAARYSPGPATCLTRSLVLAWLLRQLGPPALVRIGVRFVEGTLRAHAWVELDGQPVNDSPDIAGQFASFDATPPLRAFDR
jgi:hypothetical protein